MIQHQKPQIVIDAISKYYEEINANIHRVYVQFEPISHRCLWDFTVKFKITSTPNFPWSAFTLEPLWINLAPTDFSILNQVMKC
jgi:hypothetical protein